MNTVLEAFSQSAIFGVVPSFLNEAIIAAPPTNLCQIYFAVLPNRCRISKSEKTGEPEVRTALNIPNWVLKQALEASLALISMSLLHWKKLWAHQIWNRDSMALKFSLPYS